MISLAHAREIRAAMEAASASLADADALTAVEMFPAWDATATYAADARVRHGGVLYRCITAHDAQESWAPGDAPSLWAQVLVDPGGEPSEWVQPDSTNPYMKGDRVTFEGHVYESLIDNNVWSPSAYPDGWLLIE